MTSEGVSASSAGFAVDYESVPQFTRNMAECSARGRRGHGGGEAAGLGGGVSPTCRRVALRVTPRNAEERSSVAKCLKKMVPPR